ncbi:MAG: hypothetical protein SGBAC_004458 [Bacillariaceae sp.]
MKSQILFTALMVAAVATEVKSAPENAMLHRELRPVRIVATGSNEGGAWGHCEGDCDVNDDCYHNLVCFQRAEGKATPVPGCKGGDEDLTDTDYCVFPGDIPLSGNLFEEHVGDHLNDEPLGLSEPTPQTTILAAEDPDEDTATDPPLNLVGGVSGVSSLNQQSVSIALLSTVSAALLVAFQA